MLRADYNSDETSAMAAESDYYLFIIYSPRRERPPHGERAANFEEILLDLLSRTVCAL